MKINIQFVDMTTSETMTEYTIGKVTKLSKKYDDIIHADVSFKKGNDTKGNSKICDIELSLYGPRLYASANEKNFELAVKNAITELEKQLEKRAKKIKPYI